MMIGSRAGVKDHRKDRYGGLRRPARANLPWTGLSRAPERIAIIAELDPVLLVRFPGDPPRTPTQEIPEQRTEIPRPQPTLNEEGSVGMHLEGKWRGW
jgi:hypothetical protein